MSLLLKGRKQATWNSLTPAPDRAGDPGVAVLASSFQTEFLRAEILSTNYVLSQFSFS